MKDLFELVARYLVPSIRRHLARELINRGMSEAEAARALGLSRSAITRYVKSERGAGIELSRFSDVAKMIEELAAKIITSSIDKSKMLEETAEITSYILSRKYFCAHHKRLDPEINVSRCKICPTIFIRHPASNI